MLLKFYQSLYNQKCMLHMERTRDIVFRDNVNRAGNAQEDDITLRRCAGVTIG